MRERASESSRETCFVNVGQALQNQSGAASYDRRIALSVFGKKRLDM